MIAGSWLDSDGKFRQYGTQKAVPEVAGDYLAYGETRCIEMTLNLANLGTTALAQSYTTFFPNSTQVFVEKVVVDVEAAAVGGTSVSVGVGYLTPGTLTNPPAVTTISDTAFVNALVTASINAAGDQVVMTAGSTSAGGFIGTSSSDQTHKNYITAKVAGTYSAGTLKVRIYYRGLGTITQ